MTFPDDGETIGLFEPLMVSEGSPTRAGLNDLVLELAEKSAAFRSSLPASANYRGRTVDVDGLSGFKCPACGEIEFDTEGGRAPSATPQPATHWFWRNDGRPATNRATSARSPIRPKPPA